MIPTVTPPDQRDEKQPSAAEADSDVTTVPLPGAVVEVVRAMAHGGDLQAAGAFNRTTTALFAKTFDLQPEYSDDFLLRAISAGVSDDQLTTWLAAVEWARPGGGMRLVNAEVIIACEP